MAKLCAFLNPSVLSILFTFSQSFPTNWPVLVSTSHPYTGATPPAQADGDYATTHVGDTTDTSPFPTDQPVTGISTGTYIQNMTTLIDWLEQVK